MHTITADNQKRIRIPDAKPGQVFAYTDNGDGSILLTPVKAEAKEPFPPGSLVDHVKELNRDWKSAKIRIPEPEGLD